VQIFSIKFEIKKILIGNVNGKTVKCLVCRDTVKEIRDAQAKVDPKKKAEVKAGRFNVDGSLSGQLIELRRSEQYLTELFEGDDGICKTMDDYAKAKYKSSGELTILKMFLDGAMVRSECMVLCFVSLTFSFSF
jgi:hypothetical protein